jgi:hypothetical protein
MKFSITAIFLFAGCASAGKPELSVSYFHLYCPSVVFHRTVGDSKVVVSVHILMLFLL